MIWTLDGYDQFYIWGAADQTEADGIWQQIIAHRRGWA